MQEIVMAAKAKAKSGGKAKGTPRKRGRPTIYSAALAAEFCRRLELGRSVIDVCGDEDMPCQDTIYEWRRTKPEFSEKYVGACEGREDYFAEEDIELEAEVLRGRLKHDRFSVVMNNRWRRRERLARKKFGKSLQVDHNVGLTLAQALDELEGGE